MTAGPLALPAHAVPPSPGDERYQWKAPATRSPGSLPPEAQAIFDEIEDSAEDQLTVTHAATEKLRDEREDRNRLAAHIANMERNYPTFIVGDREYERSKKDLERADAKVADLRARHEAKSERWNNTASLRNSITAFLTANAGAMLQPWVGAAPVLGKSEQPAEAVERCRQALREKRVVLDRVAKAPLTLAEAKAAARHFVEACGNRARPDLSSLFGGDSAPHWFNLPSLPSMPVQFGSGGPVYDGGSVHDGLCLMAWISPEPLLARILADLDALGEDSAALTAEHKAAQTAELQAAILQLERDEEAFLRMALATGSTIERRSGADPRAVLMIEVEAANDDDGEEIVMPARPNPRRLAAQTKK